MSNLIRFNQPFTSIFDEMDRNINRFVNNNNSDYWLPDIDIKEDGNNYTVKADVPGMDKKDIKIHVDQYNNLVIEGERESEVKKEKKDFLCFERYKGSFFRKIALPSTVDAQNIKAKYRDGVLEISVPKAREGGAKRISIDD